MGCCTTLTGIVRDCASNIGGIRRAWIACYDEVSTIIETNNQITSILPTSAWHEYEFRKQTGSVEITPNKDDANGTLYYQAVISLVFSKWDTPKRLEVEALGLGDLAIIIEDNNGHYWYFGIDNYVSMSGGSASTGTAFGDLNGYTLEFEYVGKYTKIEVTEDAMQDIISNA